MNAHEAEARLRKAMAIADALDAAGITDVDSLAPEVRDVAVAVAGVRPPSEATWAEVRTLLRKRAALRAALPADPFDGLA